MIRDLRLGMRVLLERPAFTLLVTLTLALGIGATAAVFSLVEGALLTPPPYRDPARLVLIASARADGDEGLRPQDWAATQWQEWREEATAFEALAAYRWTFSFWVREEGSESLSGLWVTRDYFRVTGLEPVLGRTFLASDTEPGAVPVVLLGHELWQRRFGGDPDVVGRTLRMSRRETPPTIVGVMPPGVRFLPSASLAQEPNYDVDAVVDYWAPVIPDPRWVERPMWNVVGRLREEVALAAAQAEIEGVVSRQAQQQPDLGGTVPRLRPLIEETNRAGRRILLPLLGAAALVLLIACGNAAALLLVRGLERQREWGVRVALGAGRFALFRQVTIESLVFALVGSALGMVLAVLVVGLFRKVGGHAIPRMDAVATGWPVLLSGLVAAVVAAGLAGLVPALRASRLDPVDTLREAGPKTSAGRGERRMLTAVAMAQTALTLSLLVGAGLLIRTMVNLSDVRPGYDVGSILTMSVTAVEGDWESFHRRALEHVSAVPGVAAAAFAWGVPLTGNNWPGAVEIEGQPAAARDGDRLSLPLRSVTSGYFDLLGLELREGRDFRPTDTEDQPPVAIVNQALAERFFPGAGALGKRLWLRGRDEAPAQVIGVVADARTDDLTQPAGPEIYLSLWQWGAYSKHLVVRAGQDPAAIAAAVERELRTVDPTVAVENVATLERLRGDSLAPRRFAMQLLAGFAVTATLLTIAGISGVLFLSVASRRREMAIRSAVGAQRRDLLALVFGEGARLIAFGVAAGLLATVASSRALGSLLYGVAPADPVTLAGVTVLFVAVGLLACWVPARRAAGVDPAEALREQ